MYIWWLPLTYTMAHVQARAVQLNAPTSLRKSPARKPTEKQCACKASKKQCHAQDYLEAITTLIVVSVCTKSAGHAATVIPVKTQLDTRDRRGKPQVRILLALQPCPAAGDQCHAGRVGPYRWQRRDSHEGPLVVRAAFAAAASSYLSCFASA